MSAFGLGATTKKKKKAGIPPSLFTSIKNLAGNSNCFECNAQKPEWAAIFFGTLVCVGCAGRHRKLGTHISLVKSTLLDKWKLKEIRLLQRGGNTRFSEYCRSRNIMDKLWSKYNSKEAQAYRKQLEAGTLSAAPVAKKVVKKVAEKVITKKVEKPVPGRRPTAAAAAAAIGQTDEMSDLFGSFDLGEPSPTSASPGAAAAAAAANSRAIMKPAESVIEPPSDGLDLMSSFGDDICGDADLLSGPAPVRTAERRQSFGEVQRRNSNDALEPAACYVPDRSVGDIMSLFGDGGSQPPPAPETRSSRGPGAWPGQAQAAQAPGAYGRQMPGAWPGQAQAAQAPGAYGRQMPGAWHGQAQAAQAPGAYGRQQRPGAWHGQAQAAQAPGSWAGQMPGAWPA